MSCMDKDLEFHGTKKGGRRKTVSKRRAYMNTPSKRKREYNELAFMIEIAIEQLGRKQYRQVSSTLNTVKEQLETLE